MIRKAVKEILHLPTWVSTDWIHNRNGGNITNLMRIAMLSQKKASEKVKKSEDPIALTIGDRIDPLNGERLERLKMTNTNHSKIKEEQRKRSEEKIEQQNNEKAVITIFDSKISRDWIWTDRGLSPGDKIRCIHALSNTTPTNNNKYRGDMDMTKRRCRQCKSV